MSEDIIRDPEEARRFARVIVSDIAAYNESKVREGIESDTLFSLLSEEIEEGELFYRSRVTPEIVTREQFFQHAIVDLLVKSKGYIKSKIW